MPAHTRRRFLTSFALLIFSLFASAVATAAENPSQAAAGPWLGDDGEPLPFTTAEEILDFLENAPIVKTKKLSDGINKPLKIKLERDGIVADAIFRSVDVEREETMKGGHPGNRHFRDSYVFEVAAFELDQLLGLGRVPPAVLRRVEGRRGSVQLWVEKAMTEAHRLENKIAPAEISSWQLQRQIMIFFDNLIYNFDRNPGNMLLGEDGKLWFVDHTRSFKQVPMLPETEKLAAVERGLYERLEALEPAEIRERLSPYLGGLEISALLERRELLIKHVEKLAAGRGEDVFFELSD